MDQLDNTIDNTSQKPAKPPVVRGARACTVCRAAKMKCVGAEDGQKQCQRCKRAGVDCIFEKHRRGRKPGSKLSEASKMLRRLEKGLNNAKLKSQSTESTLSPSYAGADRNGTQDGHYSGVLRSDQYGSPRFPSNELPPLNLPPYHHGDGYEGSSHGSRSMDVDEDDDDPDRNEDMFPAKLIRKENQRHSFFRTILNPEHEPPSASGNRGGSFPLPTPRSANPPPNTVNDPISTGIIEEDQVKVLFDLLFLRLNPYINLFDPALHTVNYVRNKCPFLFTTLIMAGCKFFKPELYKQCRKMANELAIRAFAEQWTRVEVVQAYACLTYWKEPDESRTWTYIGLACRMAVELGLNRYVAHPPVHENEFQMRERRNRERTYLVLFVHDRSLSMQTGRHWMLPEDDLVRHSHIWHEQGGATIRQEDVIVAAFVQLRCIAAETTDMFYSTKGGPGNHNDVNYEVVLRNCNGKLTQWMDTWKNEMRRANGEAFHFSMLSLFRLYVRLFLNSFGVQASMSPTSRASPSLQALSACCTSALDTLKIVSENFASMSMLRYGQDSITIMTAYSAIFLLKLLRSSNTLAQLHEGTAHEIHSLISKTADAYHDASVLSPASTAAAYHARFLRSLVANDIHKARQNEKDKFDVTPIDPRLQGGNKQRSQPVVPSYNERKMDVLSPGASSSHSHASSAQLMQHQTHTQQQQQQQQQQPPPPMYPPQGIVNDHGQHSYQFPPPPPPPPHSAPLRETEYSPDPNMRGPSGPGTNGGMSAPPHQPHPPYSPPVPVASATMPNGHPLPQHASELDAHYWRNMFLELGFGGENTENTGTPHMNGTETNDTVRAMSYTDNQGHQNRHPQHQALQQQPQSGHPSHPSSHPGYQNHAIHQVNTTYQHMHPQAHPSYAR